MLETIRRWFPRRGAGLFPDLADWADARRYGFKAKPEGDGLIVESTAPGDAWRLEWGASRRSYIPGFELRLRATLGAADAVQMLVLTRPLMHALEAEIFKQYTEDLQTRADTATPDEMRWLVLYPKLSATELGPLRDHFGAAGHPKEAVAQWLGGDLSQALAMAATGWLPPDDPLVLVVQRGQLTLRMPMAVPALAPCESALALLRTAARAAMPVLERWGRPTAAPSTQPSLWAPSSDGRGPR